jgi:hypothetical protein
MDDIIETTLVTDPVTEVSATLEQDPVVADESNLEDQDDAEADGEEPEFEEVEYLGNKYKVPKDLAPVLQKAENLEAGVTRRFQEAAELRKATEAEREQVQQEAQVNHEIIEHVAQLRWVESRLAQFQNVNWMQWQAQDATAASAASAEFMQLQAAQKNLRGEVDSRKADIEARNEQRAATMISQAIETLSKPDPEYGWDGKFNAEKQKEISDYLAGQGLSAQEIAGINHPVAVKTAWAAAQYKKLLSKQKAAATPAKTVANPVPQVNTGKTRSSVNPDKLPMDQWVKYERERMKKAGVSR